MPLPERELPAVALRFEEDGMATGGCWRAAAECQERRAAGAAASYPGGGRKLCASGSRSQGHTQHPDVGALDETAR
jgi:hypothetical protein